MKKLFLSAALSVIGSATLAHAGPPAQAEAPSKAANIFLLKKVAKAKPANVANPTKISDATIAANDENPVAAVLKLPAPASKIRAQELPGLGTTPGDASDIRIKSVRVGTDRNELVYISQSQLNKISTPFDSPQIIDSTGATLKAVGQDLFLQPASDKPLTVYITNGGVGQSIGLTLVPRMNLPAQTIVLLPDSPSGSPAVKAEVEDIVASDYVSRITALVKSLALGKTPPGFTRSRLPLAVVAGNELVIEPQYKFGGSSYDIYSYKVRSVSTIPLELKEEAFYTDAVRAVAFYPSALLQSGEDTTVFVIADRTSKESAQ